MVCSGVGPVTVEELKAAHNIEVINLPGKGVDETATHALVSYLNELSTACEGAGISLAMRRPDPDDLEGSRALPKPPTTELLPVVLDRLPCPASHGELEQFVELVRVAPRGGYPERAVPGHRHMEDIPSIG